MKGLGGCWWAVYFEDVLVKLEPTRTLARSFKWAMNDKRYKVKGPFKVVPK